MGESTMHFTIAGEFVTNIARQWFWKEDKPYNVCEQLLLGCLVSDQITDDMRRQFARDIIEGRKKLIGDSHSGLELVDDGKNIHTIDEKLEEMELKRKKLEFRLDMEHNPLKYVDPYSTIRSLDAYKQDLADEIVTIDRIHDFFASEDPYYLFSSPITDDRYFNEQTKMGLWLLEDVDFAWKATENGTIEPGSEEFWYNIYELTKDSPDPSFIQRTRRYAATMRMRISEPHTSENDLLKENRELLSKLGVDESAPESVQWTARTLQHVHKCIDAIDTVIIPDEFQELTGLISPKGDFFSCSFGGHNYKAYNLIYTHPDWFPGLDYDADLRMMDRSNALDTLLKQGWCAIRSTMPHSGYYIDVPPLSSGKQPTKAQIDAIYDAMIHHDATRISGLTELV